MFKKAFKLSTSHNISGKDLKKLKQQLEKLNYSQSVIEKVLQIEI